eukprot:scaffold747_cov120-Cylindrotheca_fusiformis.AAC.16
MASNSFFWSQNLATETTTNKNHTNLTTRIEGIGEGPSHSQYEKGFFPLRVEAIAKSEALALTSSRDDYASPESQPPLDVGDVDNFRFERFQSPKSIQRALQSVRRKSPFKWFEGKDGRKGFVSSTKLAGDWVLAESQQVATDCTTHEVLQAYLSGDLQQKWNKKEVLFCRFRQKKFEDEDSISENKSRLLGGKTRRVTFRKGNKKLGKGQQLGVCYQQDLLLQSQRVIRSHTGVMKYSQEILIDKIGDDNYAVLVRLDPRKQMEHTTAKKPFESLSVYVGLQQRGKDVDIYAAGVMQVNRKVVPNLVVFDASGIAGSMAGKGTLWLAGHFDQRRSALER